ncbi:MAG: hypothetical protein EA369_00200 [Bradymonadales bacterium]|nr:MAG: hypothetical protein EA369_00200 [Bradymonadales bacterium]
MVSRKHYIFCVSEHGRLPLFKRSTSAKEFVQRLKIELLKTLDLLGLGRAKIDREVHLLEGFKFAKTNNRSVLGGLKQFKTDLQSVIDYQRLDLDDSLAITRYLLGMGSTQLAEFTVEDTVRILFEGRLGVKSNHSHLGHLDKPLEIGLQQGKLSQMFKDDFDEEIRERGQEYFELDQR